MLGVGTAEAAVGTCNLELFGAWLEGVYQRTVHSETGQTPLDRRLAGRQLRRPSPTELHEAFLWSETRLVTKTSSVSLYGNHYEVDPALVGVRVELVFDPFDLTDIQVRYQDRPMGRAIPRHIGRHVHPAARPETAPTPRPSGIDYLGLVAGRVSAEERSRMGISYSRLAAQGDVASATNPEEDQTR